MRRTNHISLSRVAANGAASAPQRGCRVGGPAPPGAETSAVTTAFRRAPRGPLRGLCAVGWLGRGCSPFDKLTATLSCVEGSRTGPATANAESPTEVARAPDESSRFLTWCSAMASRELLLA